MVTISGTVTDQDGNAIEGVTVTVYNEVNEIVADSGTTDSNGEFSFDVGSDSYHVMLSYEETGGDQYNIESNPFVT